MVELYQVNVSKEKSGIEEALKDGMNQILDCGGPFTLAIAIENYVRIKNIAIGLSIDTKQYDNKFDQFKQESRIR